MKVITARYSGFCPGVVQAEKKIFGARLKAPGEPIFILGYLIHNQTYIDYLSRNSVTTVSSPEELPEGSRVIIRTHGLQRQVEETLRTNHRVLDLTCPKVKKIQLMIKDRAEKGCFIIITGKKDHPEVQGLVSYAENSAVIETETDITRFTENFGIVGSRKIFVVSQTTGDPGLFAQTVRMVGEKAAALGVELESLNSICSITSMREGAALKLQKKVDVTFIIGDKISSNATKLYKVLAARSPAVFFVNSRKDAEAVTARERDPSWETAQVVSSSSTPAFLEQEIVEYLESL